MAEYTSDQLALERQMAERGEAREHAQYSAALERDALTTTKPGRALMRKLVGPTMDHLNRWLLECGGGPGPVAGAAPRVAEVGTEVAALLACQVVVDGLHRPRTVTAVCSAIGLTLEDEWRFGRVARDNPGLWREARRRMVKAKPSVRRRIMLKLGKFHHALPDKWTRSERVKAGAAGLDAILACGNIAEMQTWREGKRRRLMVLATTELLEWLERSVDAAAASSPLHLPCLDDPAPWTSPEGGGYLTDLVLHRPVARFRSKAQRAALDDPGASPALAYGALNTLQATRWRVHEDVRQVLEDTWEGGAGRAGLPPREDEPLPPMPPEAEGPVEPARDSLVTEKDEQTGRVTITQVNMTPKQRLRAAWRGAAAKVHKRNGERRSRRALYAMTRAVAAQFSDVSFAYPHRMDFRGRCYPSPYFLQAQGPDLARGLLRFDSGSPLGKWDAEDSPAWDALMVHGANVWGAKGTLYARAKEGRRLWDAVGRRVNADPLEHRGWEDADEPWQFMAWALEVGRLSSADHRKGRPLTHLPVAADASNNGLQLFALMTGDRELAEWTNAIPGPDQPRDIYTEVAGRATERLRTLAAGGDREAQQWVALLGSDGVPRSASKRPVMTLPYGVTLWSAQHYVKDWYNEQWQDDGPFGDAPGPACLLLARCIMGEVAGVCQGAVGAMRWIQSACGEVTGTGTALRWVSPSGWPVVQHYRKTRAKRIKADLAGSIRRLTIREGTGGVDPREQAQGSAPNFVHSVDAAVLHTALAGWDAPVAAVHDSFATTAPLQPLLLSRLRDAVARCTLELDPLARLHVSLTAQCPSANIGPPPRLGVIDPDEVRASAYMFS